MNTHAPRHTADDLAFDARFASSLSAPVHDELAHARARRALVAAAEARLAGASPKRASHLRVVTALAFAAATAAAAAAVTMRASLASHEAPVDAAPVGAEPAQAAQAAQAANGRGGASGASQGEPAEVDVVAAPSVEPSVAPSLEHAVTERGASFGAGRVAAPRTPALPPTPTSPNEANAPTPGERFAEAMRAYLAGDFASAEARFDAFCIDYADDARAEDAAFLRADARAKHGDFQGARAAARSYLKRYPRGLRRPEAERLAAAGL